MSKKNIKSTIYIVLSLLIVFLVFGIIVNSLNLNKQEYSKPVYPTYDDAFYVNNYNIDIVGSKDRTFKITEEIEVYYTKPRSVLLRDIPVNSGEKIRDLKVENNDYLKSSFEYGFYTIELGTEYPKITGLKTYKFSYTLITPIMKNYENSLYLNVVGGGWPEIKQVNVNFEFPSDNLISDKYYQGALGESTNSNLTITKNLNQVNIKNKDKFNPNEALTVLFEYKEGYLTEYNSYYTTIIIAIFSIIAVLLVFVFYFIFGTEDEPVEVVNFEPPFKMNPIEIGYLIDNNCSKEDVVSIFFYFASKGLIKIVDTDGKYSFEKLKEISNDFSTEEIALFNKLFNKGSKVEVEELTYQLANDVERLRIATPKKYGGKLYNNKSMSLSIVVLIIACVLFFIPNYMIGLTISTNYFNMAGFFGIGGLVVAYVGGISLVYNKYKMSKSAALASKIGLVIVQAIIYIMYLFFISSQTLNIFDCGMLSLSFILVSLIIPSILNRTPYYNDILGNILGFKNFLMTAEKERLETMINENPNYYFDILPYAQVLGVSDVWTDRFKNLTLEMPNYYYSNRVTLFDIYFYNKFYRSATTSFRQMSMPKPSSNSSSGFKGGGFGGGGGFSGGGFGGGGGRSR